MIPESFDSLCCHFSNGTETIEKQSLTNSFVYIKLRLMIFRVCLLPCELEGVHRRVGREALPTGQ